MIRPLATTNGADIFGLVKRGKAPRFPFQSAPSPRYAPRQSLENYRADRHGIASRCLSSGHAAGRVSASLVRKPGTNFAAAPNTPEVRRAGIIHRGSWSWREFDDTPRRCDECTLAEQSAAARRNLGRGKRRSLRSGRPRVRWRRSLAAPGWRSGGSPPDEVTEFDAAQDAASLVGGSPRGRGGRRHCIAHCPDTDMVQIGDVAHSAPACVPSTVRHGVDAEPPS
jgi:hypothetical protein